jgi:hypothetical protein
MLITYFLSFVYLALAYDVKRNMDTVTSLHSTDAKVKRIVVTEKNSENYVPLIMPYCLPIIWPIFTNIPNFVFNLFNDPVSV